ncbi:MAG TPA: protein kinase [Gemmatimonadales bacterium]
MTNLSRLASALADRYRIERELGQGGMATVYLAEDLKHHRKVAVKVLRPELAAAIGPERFLREIETTANLRHPHILPVYDSGEAGKQGSEGGTFLYYVMPLVEGESLRDRLNRQKQLPIDEALGIAGEVADALGYAHQRGVIHRDIKPENILLEGGHAVVADFGIARAMSMAGADRLTQTGMSIGTPMYMSPEQAAADPNLDGRSDLYSLGCVLYEMLGGQPPFTGPTAEVVARQHLLTEAAPVTNLRPTVPPEVAGALARSLAKNPADRYNPVAQFADALRAGSGVAKVQSKRGASSPRRSSNPLWITIAALALLMLIGSFFYLRRGGGSAAGGGSSVAVLPFVDLSADRADTHLGDGISETLSNALANVPGLSVAARTSAFAFRDKSEDVREIGRQLGVASVLEGSVQRAGDRLRVTAQLIKTVDGLHLWSQSFDRGTADIFAVQDEVARAVVSALQLRLVATTDSISTRGGTRNADAYDAYLLGRYHWNRRTTEGMIDAAVAFKKALALDSSYALAWAGLADTYVLSIPQEYDVPGINPDSILTLAEQSARRALVLAPRLGEALASLGEILEYRNRWDEATDAFEQGIALTPAYATGHQWYSYHLMVSDRWDEAIREMETAHRLDPLSHVITLSLAAAYDGADRFAEATPLYDQGLAQSPEAYYAWAARVGHELALGRMTEAITALRKSFGGRAADSGRAARLERGLTDPATRAATVDELGRGADPNLAIPFFRWLRGDDATLTMLESSVAAGHSPGTALFPYVLVGPKLRANPRLQALAQRLGWPPVQRPSGTP